MGRFRLLPLVLLCGFTAAPPPAEDVSTIVQRWTDANRRDFQAAQLYSYFETIRTDEETKTYVVTLLSGCPYRRQVSGDALADAAHQETVAFAEARHQHETESSDEHQQRLANFQKNRERAQAILEEMPRAFDYTLRSTREANSRTLYVLEATPRRGYDPPTVDARVLTGMRGEFWIDAKTHQLFRGSATVVHPVTIDGFLATVQPGTSFEVEQHPVGDGIWLPTHVSIHSRSNILFLLHHHTSQDRTYFDYHKASAVSVR